MFEFFGAPGRLDCPLSQSLAPPSLFVVLYAIKTASTVQSRHAHDAHARVSRAVGRHTRTQMQARMTHVYCVCVRSSLRVCVCACEAVRAHTCSCVYACARADANCHGWACQSPALSSRHVTGACLTRTASRMDASASCCSRARATHAHQVQARTE